MGSSFRAFTDEALCCCVFDTLALGILGSLQAVSLCHVGRGCRLVAVRDSLLYVPVVGMPVSCLPLSLDAAFAMQLDAFLAALDEEGTEGVVASGS